MVNVNKLILAISMLLPSLILASTEKGHAILQIDSATESESLIVEKILSNQSNVIKVNKDASNNLTIQLNESQERIEDLIFKLRTELGDSIKIEKLPVNLMKKGTQDFGGM